MVIGLRCGTDQVDDSYTRQRTYILVQKLMERFRDVRKLGLPGQLITLAAEVLDQILKESRD